jgi:hypothetical protein
MTPPIEVDEHLFGYQKLVSDKLQRATKQLMRVGGRVSIRRCAAHQMDSG